MNRFPWLESFLVIALAVALIVKPQTRVVSGAMQTLAPVSRVDIGKTAKPGDVSVSSSSPTGSDKKGEPGRIDPAPKKNPQSP